MAEETGAEALEAEIVEGETALARQSVHQGGRMVLSGAEVGAVRRATFLRELQRRPVVGLAARAAGLSVEAVYELRAADGRFRLAWDEAMTGAVDAVEGVLVDKALGGDTKAIDMVLQAHRPERYRHRQEVAVVQDAVIQVSLIPAKGGPD